MAPLQPLPPHLFANQVIGRKTEKRATAHLVEGQALLVAEFDKAVEANARGEPVSVSDEASFLVPELERVLALDQDAQDAWYHQQLANLEQIKQRHHSLRLLGDEIHVWLYPTMEECVLEITPLSELLLHEVTFKQHTHRSKDPHAFLKQYAVDSAHEVSNQRVMESRYCRQRWSINALHRFRPDPKISAKAQKQAEGCQVGGIVLEWRDRKSSATRLVVEEADELEHVLGLHLRRYNASRVHVVTRIREQFALKQAVFDKQSEVHRRMLQGLWTAVFPRERFPGPVAKGWLRLGFQGEDPSTDFRSTGLLSLHTLTTYAQAHPENMRELIQMHPEREYPVAASAINITSVLSQLLGMSKDKMNLAPADAQWDTPLFVLLCHLQATYEHPFAEVFGVCLRLLDYTFLRMQATYMDYPKAIAHVKDAIIKAFAAKCRIPEGVSGPAKCAHGPLCLAEVTESAFAHVDKVLAKTTKKNQHSANAWQRAPSMVAYAVGDARMGESVGEEADEALGGWDAGVPLEAGAEGANSANGAKASARRRAQSKAQGAAVHIKSGLSVKPRMSNPGPAVLVPVVNEGSNPNGNPNPNPTPTPNGNSNPGTPRSAATPEPGDEPLSPDQPSGGLCNAPEQEKGDGRDSDGEFSIL